MDHIASEICSAVLVEEEGTVCSFRGLLETIVAKGLPCSLWSGIAPDQSQNDRPTHMLQNRPP